MARGIAVVTGSNTKVHKFLEDGTAIMGDQLAAAVEISGTLKLELGGTEGNLKYLKSDASGIATWDQVDAVDVAVTPTGTLAATDVQGALEELQVEIDSLSAGSGSSGLSFGTTVGNAELQVSGAVLLWEGTANEVDVSFNSSTPNPGATITFGLPADVTISNDLTVQGSASISGDLTVLGTTTTIDTQNLFVEDPLITLASGNATDSLDLGLVLTRSSSNQAVLWDESADEFALISTSDDGTTSGNVTITDYSNLHIGGLDVDDSTTLGTNSGDTLTVNATSTFVENVNMNGATTTIGDASSDVLVVNSEISSSLIPDVDNAFDLGNGKRWRNMFLSGNADIDGTLNVQSAATLQNDLTVDGNTTLGDASGDTLTVNATSTFLADVTLNGTNLNVGNATTDTVNLLSEISGNLIPDADNAFDIGALAKRWKDLFLEGNADIDGTLDVESTTTLGNTTTITTGGLVVSAGGAQITGNLDVAGEISSSGNAKIGGDLTVDGNSTINNGNHTVNGEIFLSGCLNIDSDLDGTAAKICEQGDALILASGSDHAPAVNQVTTAERDALTPLNGMIVYNTTTGQFEGYDDGWQALGAGGTVPGTENESFCINTDAVSSSTAPEEDPYFCMYGYDGTVGPNGEVIQTILRQDSSADRIYLYQQESSSADTVADRAIQFVLGPIGDFSTSSLNADSVLRFKAHDTGDAAGTFKSSAIFLDASEDKLYIEADSAGTGSVSVSARIDATRPRAFDVLATHDDIDNSSVIAAQHTRNQALSVSSRQISTVIGIPSQHASDATGSGIAAVAAGPIQNQGAGGAVLVGFVVPGGFGYESANGNAGMVVGDNIRIGLGSGTLNTPRATLEWTTNDGVLEIVANRGSSIGAIILSGTAVDEGTGVEAIGGIGNITDGYAFGGTMERTAGMTNAAAINTTIGADVARHNGDATGSLLYGFLASDDGNNVGGSTVIAYAVHTGSIYDQAFNAPDDMPIVLGLDDDYQQQWNGTAGRAELSASGGIRIDAAANSESFVIRYDGSEAIKVVGDGSGNGGIAFTHVAANGTSDIVHGSTSAADSGRITDIRHRLRIPVFTSGSTVLSDYETNAATLHGHMFYLTGSGHPTGVFQQANKWYFNENGAWHPSPFISE
jgi:hypothetical protein